MVQTMGKTSVQRRGTVGVRHLCPFCLTVFIGVRQKKYCSKPCLEAACRARKAALIDALTLEYASFGLSRANIERAVQKCLERAQQLAARLQLEYFERERTWMTRPVARVWLGAS